MSVDDASVARGRARSQTLVVGILTSVLNRGLAAAIPLLVVPIGLNYLGATGYGVWATALSLTGLVVFADLGIGTGLMTRLGALDIDDDDDAATARRYVASAYAMASVVSLVSLVALLGSARWVDWPALVGIPPESAASAVEPIVLVTLSGFIVNIVGGLIVRVQYGLGQQGRSNLWQTAGGLATLAGTYLGAALDQGSGAFVACAAYAAVATSFLNAVTFFNFSPIGKRIRPRLHNARVATTRALVSLGAKFLVLSVLMSVSIALDPWIVARTAAIDEVPNYSIPFRLFALIGAISVMLTLPLWPLHARALSSGDIAWIRRITRLMTTGSALTVAVVCVLAVVAGPRFLNLWLDNQVDAPPALWIGLAIWWIVQSLTGPAFMVQNGAEILRPQTVGYLLLLLAFPVKWWVSQRFGYEWIPYVGCGFYVLFVWPACYVGYSRAVAPVRHRRKEHDRS
jgi:O-antigen/teichoic acid export membrane protein